MPTDQTPRACPTALEFLALEFLAVHNRGVQVGRCNCCGRTGGLHFSDCHSEMLPAMARSLAAAEARADSAEKESAGRLRVLEEKAAEAASEWRRAESAEARAHGLRIACEHAETSNAAIREILTRYLAEPNVVITAAVRPEIRRWLAGKHKPSAALEERNGFEMRAAAAESENARLKGELEALRMFHKAAGRVADSYKVTSTESALHDKVYLLGQAKVRSEAEVSRLKEELAESETRHRAEMERLCKASGIEIPEQLIMRARDNTQTMYDIFVEYLAERAAEIDRLKAEVGRLEAGHPRIVELKAEVKAWRSGCEDARKDRDDYKREFQARISELERERDEAQTVLKDYMDDAENHVDRERYETAVTYGLDQCNRADAIQSRLSDAMLIIGALRATPPRYYLPERLPPDAIAAFERLGGKGETR